VRRQPVLEKAIVGRIMTNLKKRPGVVVRKRHGTAMGVAGDPDIYGTIRGRHFEIEIKRPHDPSSQLTELQTRRLLEWKLAGAITGVARSVDDALQILGLLRPAKPDEPRIWICSGCRDPLYSRQGSEPPARCLGCGHTRFELEQGVA
jgi:hypothetical protein